MRILVGYDGSPGADAAVDAAGRLFPDGDIAVLTVWQSARESAPAALVALPMDVVQDALDELDRAAEEGAHEIAARGAGRLPAADTLTEPVEASVWSTIDRAAARDGAACVVVGSRGRSELAAAVLGSVAQGLVHHGSLPVVVVPAR